MTLDHPNRPKRLTTIIQNIFYFLLSPTFHLADYLKLRNDRTTIIKELNTGYLIVSVISFLSIWIFQYLFELESLYELLCPIIVGLWSWFLISRANEIFYAFLKDAFDKMDSHKGSGLSNLSFPDRIRLSLKSYLELILDFAILFALTKPSFWKNSIAPTSITDATYFSGITITTTGYGDFTPSNWYPQFLAIYEVFCGVILLVVCFAIYASRTQNSKL